MTETKLPDVSHLVDPQCFLSLPVHNPPHPFPVNPPSDIQDPYQLYKLRFYRHAADLCREQLLSIPLPANTNDSISKVFRLWSIRLSALFMVRMSGIARDESQVFGNLGDNLYRTSAAGQSIVPWNLRLLVVRIQSGGPNQQAIDQYYLLSREARTNTQREKVYLQKLLAKKKALENEIDSSEPTDSQKNIRHQLEISINDTRKLLAKWKSRLRNIGLFISSMLMGMRDTKSALSLLQSLYNSQIPLLKEDSEIDHETSIAEKLKEDYSENELAKLISTRDSLNELKSFLDKVIFTQAMLYLQIGDTISSRQSFAKLGSPTTKGTFSSAVLLGNAMCAIADTDWDEAEKLLNKLASLKESTPEADNVESETDEKDTNTSKQHLADLSTSTPFQVSVANNLAITRINQAKLSSAISILEDLVFQGNVISPVIMTNLSILYDLQQEVGRRMKNRLLVELKNQGYLALENYDFLQ